MLVDYFQPLFLFVLLSFALLTIARSTGFLRLPPTFRVPPPVSGKTVLISFLLYLTITNLIAPIGAWLMEAFYWSWFKTTLPETFLGYTQVLLLILLFLLFYLYCQSEDPRLFKRIWKISSLQGSRSIYYDIGIGILTWFISFPVATLVGQICDLSLYFFYGYEGYEQVAVHYLRSSLDNPPLFATALFTILIAAPCIEEFLFRGCLQSFLKNYFSVKKSIVLSSLCFSLFHFSFSQGLGNLSLCASLFVFALFLGFIYEKQRSLFASVGLHMTFNLLSTGRMLLFPE